MVKKIIILGATGGSLDVINIINEINKSSKSKKLKIIGFLDDKVKKIKLKGYKVIENLMM